MAEMWAARGRVQRDNYDSTGIQIKFDIREDEEQSAKLVETIELLVAVGYFRARIKGLPAFDKVVGGICWCVSACNVEIDVNLLYQENSSIGQKIALTERIVKVLPRMKCPHAIEPHQIQGLDMIRIFPVVQWLVKKAMESREERSEAINSFTQNQFSRRYGQNNSAHDRAKLAQLQKTDKELKDVFNPVRVFRYNAPDKPDDPSVQVRATVMEYEQDTQKMSTEKSISQESSPDKAADSDNFSYLRNEMLAVDQKSLKLSTKKIASFLGASEFKQNLVSAKTVSHDLPSIDRSLFAPVESTSHVEASSHSETEVEVDHDSLKLELESAKEKLANAKGTSEKLNSLLEQKTSSYQTAKSTLDNLLGEFAQLEEMEVASTNEKDSDLLKRLLAEQESAKQKEQAFKQTCRQDLAKLESELESLREQAKKGVVTENDITPELKAEHSQVSEELQKYRLAIAKKSREVASLQRRVDEVPSEAELSQYQSRFLELYNQISSKHKETKQFYLLYNTLLDVKIYMEKEVTLLNSLYDNYRTAMASEFSKHQFVKQFDGIVENIKQTKIMVERRQREEEIKREMAFQRLVEIQDKQRQYYKIVSDFQQECRKNEILQARLEG